MIRKLRKQRLMAGPLATKVSTVIVYLLLDLLLFWFLTFSAYVLFVSNNVTLLLVLITHLAAAESRCEKLEQQLDHMRRMLRSTRAEKPDYHNHQVNSLSQIRFK